MKPKLLLLLVLTLLCCLPLASTVAAQGPTSIGWWVVASGGGPASGGGGITLNGTTGQPIIGPASENGVTLGAGYWYGAAAMENKIYLPVVLRSYGP